MCRTGRQSALVDAARTGSSDRGIRADHPGDLEAAHRFDHPSNGSKWFASARNVVLSADQAGVGAPPAEYMKADRLL